MTIDIAPFVAIIGIMSSLLGAVGAGVGVYVTMRLEIERNRGAWEKSVAVIETRLAELEKDVQMIGSWVRANTTK